MTGIYSDPSSGSSSDLVGQLFKTKKSLFKNFDDEWDTVKSTDPEEDIFSLQLKFHDYLLESLSTSKHDLLAIYFTLMDRDPDFEPLSKTISTLSHHIRFNKLKGSLATYEFFSVIEPKFENFELENRLNLFRKIYFSKLKDQSRENEFHSWLENLIQE